jgi:hypothetical protein
MVGEKEQLPKVEPRVSASSHLNTASLTEPCAGILPCAQGSKSTQPCAYGPFRDDVRHVCTQTTSGEAAFPFLKEEETTVPVLDARATSKKNAEAVCLKDGSVSVGLQLSDLQGLCHLQNTLELAGERDNEMDLAANRCHLSANLGENSQLPYAIPLDAARSSTSGQLGAIECPRQQLGMFSSFVVGIEDQNTSFSPKQTASSQSDDTKHQKQTDTMQSSALPCVMKMNDPRNKSLKHCDKPCPTQSWRSWWSSSTFSPAKVAGIVSSVARFIVALFVDSTVGVCRTPAALLKHSLRSRTRRGRKLCTFKTASHFLHPGKTYQKSIAARWYSGLSGLYCVAEASILAKEANPERMEDLLKTDYLPNTVVRQDESLSAAHEEDRLKELCFREMSISPSEDDCNSRMSYLPHSSIELRESPAISRVEKTHILHAEAEPANSFSSPLSADVPAQDDPIVRMFPSEAKFPLKGNELLSKSAITDDMDAIGNIETSLPCIGCDAIDQLLPPDAVSACGHVPTPIEVETIYKNDSSHINMQDSSRMNSYASQESSGQGRRSHYQPDNCENGESTSLVKEIDYSRGKSALHDVADETNLPVVNAGGTDVNPVRPVELRNLSDLPATQPEPLQPIVRDELRSSKYLRSPNLTFADVSNLRTNSIPSMKELSVVVKAQIVDPDDAVVEKLNTVDYSDAIEDVSSFQLTEQELQAFCSPTLSSPVSEEEASCYHSPLPNWKMKKTKKLKACLAGNGGQTKVEEELKFPALNVTPEMPIPVTSQKREPPNAVGSRTAAESFQTASNSPVLNEVQEASQENNWFWGTGGQGGNSRSQHSESSQPTPRDLSSSSVGSKRRMFRALQVSPVMTDAIREIKTAKKNLATFFSGMRNTPGDAFQFESPMSARETQIILSEILTSEKGCFSGMKDHSKGKLEVTAWRNISPSTQIRFAFNICPLTSVSCRVSVRSLTNEKVAIDPHPFEDFVLDVHRLFVARAASKIT